MNARKGMLFVEPACAGVSNAPTHDIESVNLMVTVDVYNSMLHDLQHIHSAKESLRITRCYCIHYITNNEEELQVTSHCLEAVGINILRCYRNQCKLIRATRQQCFELYEQCDKTIWTLKRG
jgi:hypothetical protein